MSAGLTPIQAHPDYHEGFGHGVRADLDNMRDGYDTTPEYCAGFDAGSFMRAKARGDTIATLGAAK